MARHLRLFGLSLALATAGCGGAAGPAVSEADRRLGAEEHPKLLAEFGGSYDGRQAAYLARVGGKVADAAGLRGRCTFTLVNSDVVNAFAVPGCYIYVTRGLMGIVNSEGELASVLAHEVGHIVKNHSGQQQQRSLWRTLGVIAIGAITGSDRLTQIAGAAATYFTLRYSRRHEYEADDLGLAYLRKAGYDPYAAADMLGVLERNQRYQEGDAEGESAKRIPEWTLTHPLTANRIERARAAAERTGLKPDAKPEFEAEYLREVDGLLYGDDPEQGFIIGRSFAHPLMRIAFEAPPGYRLTNSPQAIFVEGPGGIRGEFSGGALPPGGLEVYARSLLDGVLGDTAGQITSARHAMVNGVEAFVLEARVATPDGSVPIAIAAYAGSNGAVYHFLTFSEPGASGGTGNGISALFGSFRVLGEAEVARLKPRYIAVRRMARDETVQALAARMAAERPADLLLMLNGRTAKDPPRPGDTVKLVVRPAD